VQALFAARKKTQGKHNNFLYIHRLPHVRSGTQVGTTTRATSPRSTSGSPGTSLRRPVAVSPSDFSFWETAVLSMEESMLATPALTGSSAAVRLFAERMGTYVTLLLHAHRPTRPSKAPAVPSTSKLRMPDAVPLW
jgi:hypothetical protein